MAEGVWWSKMLLLGFLEAGGEKGRRRGRWKGEEEGKGEERGGEEDSQPLQG